MIPVADEVLDRLKEVQFLIEDGHTYLDDREILMKAVERMSLRSRIELRNALTLEIMAIERGKQ